VESLAVGLRDPTQDGGGAAVETAGLKPPPFQRGDSALRNGAKIQERVLHRDMGRPRLGLRVAFWDRTGGTVGGSGVLEEGGWHPMEWVSGARRLMGRLLVYCWTP
jgi:hypothetical protein